MQPSPTPGGKAKSKHFQAVWLLLGSLLFYIVIWTLMPALLHSAPPLDVVESGTWGRELILMSYKHPNLPGLLIELGYQLFHTYGWPQYLLSALFVTGTVALVYRLGRCQFAPAQSAIGAMLLFGCFYFTWPVVEFNHNIAQMPFWAGFCLLLWEAVRRDRIGDWLLLGLVAGLGFYAKLSMVLVLAGGGLWILLDPTARSRLATIRPWLGLVLAAILVAPLGLIMLHNQGSAIGFIAERGTGHGGPIDFALTQFADLLPLLAIAGLLVLWPARRWRPDAASGDLGRFRVFLLVLFATPVALAMVFGTAVGVLPMWGTPMLNLTGLILVSLWPSAFTGNALRRAALGSAIFLLIAAGLYAGRQVVTAQTAESPLRTQWPQAEIAARMSGIWQKATGAPLRIVGGDDWSAGLVTLSLAPRGSVYVDLDSHISPWITPERVKAEGMLVLWPGNKVPDYLARLPADALRGQQSFAWSASGAAKPITLNYVIVPPSP